MMVRALAGGLGRDACGGASRLQRRGLLLLALAAAALALWPHLLDHGSVALQHRSLHGGSFAGLATRYATAGLSEHRG
jgi:hypothetical protein